jgi:hypothetical protein
VLGECLAFVKSTGVSAVAMIFDRKELIDDVIRRLSIIQELDLADSPDNVKWIMGLEEEFGKEPVKRALRILEARGVVLESSRPYEESDPMWDRDLDG